MAPSRDGGRLCATLFLRWVSRSFPPRPLRRWSRSGRRWRLAASAATAACAAPANEQAVQIDHEGCGLLRIVGRRHEQRAGNVGVRLRQAVRAFENALLRRCEPRLSRSRDAVEPARNIGGRGSSDRGAVVVDVDRAGARVGGGLRDRGARVPRRDPGFIHRVLRVGRCCRHSHDHYEQRIPRSHHGCVLSRALGAFRRQPVRRRVAGHGRAALPKPSTSLRPVRPASSPFAITAADEKGRGA